MKILIVDNSSVSCKNNAYYTNELNGLFIKDLINCGNNISYFQFAHDSKNTINSFNLKENGVTFHPQRIYKSKILSYCIAYLNLFLLINKSDFTYIYFPNSFKFGGFFCVLQSKKYGLYIRGMQELKSKLSKLLYKRAYAIFTVSDSFTEYINSFTKTKNLFTTRPMIPFTYSDIVTNRAYIANEKFSFLFLGRIDIEKGINELIDATKILHRRNHNFELQIVGDGIYLDTIKEKVKTLDIADIITFKGAVSDSAVIRECYLRADTFILPSYHEGFPRTIYEAMIFGTPIITTSVGGIPALMKDDINCKIVEPKSISSLVDIMEYAMKHYDRMGKYAVNARSIISNIFIKHKLSHGEELDKIIKSNDK